MSVACRLLWETPQHPYGHPCGDGVAEVTVTACKAVFVDSKCGWVACCASMHCDELCEGEVLRFGVLCPKPSPRET